MKKWSKFTALAYTLFLLPFTFFCFEAVDLFAVVLGGEKPLCTNSKPYLQVMDDLQLLSWLFNIASSCNAVFSFSNWDFGMLVFIFFHSLLPFQKKNLLA